MKPHKEIRKKYGRRFLFRILHVEALATIEGRSDDVSVADVLKEFDIPTSRQKIAASTRLQDARRPPPGRGKRRGVEAG